jgi:hypothetical protein
MLVKLRAFHPHGSAGTGIATDRVFAATVTHYVCLSVFKSKKNVMPDRGIKQLVFQWNFLNRNYRKSAKITLLSLYRPSEYR